jgi:hypothetical protein
VKSHLATSTSTSPFRYSSEPSVRILRGCWRAPWLPVGARHPLECVRPSSIRATRRIRPLLRTRFEASPETAGEIRPCAPRGSSVARTSPPALTGCPLPGLRASLVTGDRTSLRSTQRGECVQSNPTPFRRLVQQECRTRTHDISKFRDATLHLFTCFTL